LGVKPVIVCVKVLLVVFTNTSLGFASLSLRILKPRWVIVRPPGLDIVPVTDAELLVVVPL